MNEDAQTLEELQASLPMSDEVVFAPVEEFEDGNDIVEEDSIDRPLLNENDNVGDYTQSYREWAENNGIQYDENEVIETAEDFERKVSDYYIQKRFGNNPILELAENNLDINKVVDAYRQYDQVLSLNDKELYLRNQATNALNQYIKQNPGIQNDTAVHQDVYRQAMEHYDKKLSTSDPEVIKSLADPIRQKYAQARENLIPNLKQNQHQNIEQQYQRYNLYRNQMRNEIQKESFYVPAENKDFVDYFEEVTRIEDGVSEIVDRFNNDKDFFKKVIEFAYLEENGLLERAFTNKVLKSKRAAPKLKSVGGRSIGLRMIDTSKKH